MESFFLGFEKRAYYNPRHAAMYSTPMRGPSGPSYAQGVMAERTSRMAQDAADEAAKKRKKKKKKGWFS